MNDLTERVCVDGAILKDRTIYAAVRLNDPREHVSNANHSCPLSLLSLIILQPQKVVPHKRMA